MDEDENATSAADWYFGLSRRTVIFEATRIAYATGLGGAVTVLVVFGAVLLRSSGLRLPASLVSLTPLLGILLPVVLYAYDRRHDQELVIVEITLRIVRPLAALYRALRALGR
jgi:hypothetical protein